MQYEYYSDLENKYKPVAESMGPYFGFATFNKNMVKRYTMNYLGTATIELNYELNDQGYVTQITQTDVQTGSKAVVATYEYQCK